MQRESVNLEREFRIAEKSYGTDHLDLVLTNGYLGKPLGNARAVRTSRSISCVTSMKTRCAEDDRAEVDDATITSLLIGICPFHPHKRKCAAPSVASESGQ